MRIELSPVLKYFFNARRQIKLSMEIVPNVKTI